MLFKQVACICALLLVYSQLGKGHDFDRCSVGHQESEKMWVSMNLSDFENHNPKKTEIIRTKAYVKGKFPAFRVKNNESEVHFGKTRDNVWRIMYLSDDSLQEDPCFLKLEEITFLENTFNEVHFILKKNGEFSVTVVNGLESAAFSCHTQLSIFDSKQPTEVGFVYEDGKKSFLYDC